MKYKLEIVHDSTINKELSQWSKSGRIDGYTTLLIDRSFGVEDGNFRADGVSQDKYLTFIYFKEKQKQVAVEIKEEVSAKEYFTILTILDSL